MTTATSSPVLNLRRIPQQQWAAALAESYGSGLAGFLDYETIDLRPGLIEARLELRDELMIATGNFLHAGTVISFADSCTGWGCLASLPDGIAGFTTSELKVNLVGTTAMPDALVCVARLLHGGRTTQVWDATVSRERDGRAIAHFRCTQYLLAEAR